MGNIYDAQGRLGNWWTTEDLTKYRAAAVKLAAQFDVYCPFSDLCVNGKQVLGENIADLAGLLTAHDAYILSLKGKPDVVISGLTGEQRFFLAYAQVWRSLQNESYTRQLAVTDPHPNDRLRVIGTLSNMPEFRAAFACAADAPMVRKDRCQIW